MNAITTSAATSLAAIALAFAPSTGPSLAAPAAGAKRWIAALRCRLHPAVRYRRRFRSHCQAAARLADRRRHLRPCRPAAQFALGLAAIVLLVSVPQLRPTFEDAFIVDAPLPAMLLLAAIGTAVGLLHEVAHVLGAARYGVRSRMSISRRLFVIVYQTDLTGRGGCRAGSAPFRSLPE